MRLAMQLDADGCGLLLVTLSRRNLAALQSHLSQPGPVNPMLVGRYVHRDGPLIDGVARLVEAERDELHYAERESTGQMREETEAAIRWAQACTKPAERGSAE